MKKLMALALTAALLLMCAGAQADVVVVEAEVHDPVVLPITYEDIGGDPHWPSFRGLHWSMDKDVVLLIEQARGLNLTAMRDDADYSLYTADEVDVLGSKAKVYYQFSDAQGLFGVMAHFKLSGEDEADMAFIADMIDKLTEQYGAPGWDYWNDGAWSWADSEERESIAVWGRDGIGERHKDGDKFLVGQVGLKAMENSEGERILNLAMMGGLRITKLSD